MNFKTFVRVLIVLVVVSALALPYGIGGCGGGVNGNGNGNGPTVVVGDINGDGMADLVAGSGNWNNNTGRVYLFYGATISNRSAADAEAIISGEAEGDNLWGYYSEDVNDDGYYDLIAVNWRWEDAPGRIFIFYGGEGDTPISGSLSATEADVIFTGEGIDDNFRIDPGDVADVNGDGHSDIVLEAGGAVGDVGHFYVFFGPNFESKNVSEADVVVAGEQVDVWFGGLTLGDLNGDGVTDIVVSSTQHDSNRGRVYIFYGGNSLTSGTESDADVVLDGEDQENRLQSIAAGDLNGDGVDDLVCNSYPFNEERGRVYVFYGGNLSNMGAGSADVIIDGENPGDSLTWGVTHIVDVTGDGKNELIMFTGGYNEYTGRIYGFLGDTPLSSRSAGDADFVITGENLGDRLSIIDGNFFDTNGDGIKDIIAYSASYMSRRGRGYVFFGGSSLSSRNASDANVKIDGEDEENYFELLQGLDVNGDGIMDLIGGAKEYSGVIDRAGRIYLFYDGDDLTSMSATDAEVKIDGEDVNDLFGS